jgi:hypothetical protein
MTGMTATDRFRVGGARVNRWAELRWIFRLRQYSFPRAAVGEEQNILVSFVSLSPGGSLLNGMIEMQAPHFPSPWSTEEWATCFVVSDATGQPLAHVYFSDEPARRSVAKLLTRYEARGVAEHFAQLPSLLRTVEMQRSTGLNEKQRQLSAQ